jgi:hypothetical protein
MGPELGTERRLGNVRSHVSFQGRNRLDVLRLSLAAHDPTATSTAKFAVTHNAAFPVTVW